MKTSQADNLASNLSTMLSEKGTVGLKIARNLRMINDELKEYYQFKQELFKKYGEEHDGTLMINKESENFPLFIQELTPLESQEVTFDFRKITEEELANSGLTAEQILKIWEIIEC